MLRYVINYFQLKVTQKKSLSAGMQLMKLTLPNNYCTLQKALISIRDST